MINKRCRILFIIALEVSCLRWMRPQYDRESKSSYQQKIWTTDEEYGLEKPRPKNGKKRVLLLFLREHLEEALTANNCGVSS